MQFPGVGLSFYGIIPQGLPISPSLATYSIDRGQATPVALKGLSPGEVTQYNQKFFETPTLPYGIHTLKVTYDGENGNNASTPLVLDYLLIQSRNIASNSTTSLPPPTSPPVLATSAAKKVNVAGVVCGVLAAVALVLILVFLFLKYRKHKEIKFPPSSEFRASIPFLRPPPPPVQETTSFSSLGLFTPAQSRVDLATPPPTHRRRTSRTRQPPEASGSQPPRLAVASPPTVPPKSINDETSYYGGYQTWGQTKAQEAAAKKATARPRDSYM